MQYFEAFNTGCIHDEARPLGTYEFAGIALSSLETWSVREVKVASGKTKRKHCSKRISQEQEEKENGNQTNAA